ncbi:MAG: glucokinase [Chlamydiales bacterium]
MIIAGDIGGTKTNLALFDEGGNYKHLVTFKSQQYSSLRSILQEFLTPLLNEHDPSHFKGACFAIAGPVQNGVCQATNLPWVVDAAELSKALNIPNTFLINDLEANAFAIDMLSSENLYEIAAGQGKCIGNRTVISPGTGLGEAGLYWDGKFHHPFASEGGHCEFGPRDELQIDLCRYLYQRFNHASYERILSGPGLFHIYEFFREVLKREEPSWLAEEIKKDDPSKVITTYALNEKSSLCKEALTLFVSILGSEASNCALKFMALGGVYLGGGIPPKILPMLKTAAFLEGFADKGRFRSLLEEIPIRVILDDKASLKGAARYCLLKQRNTVSL